jgi:LemA protein
MRSPGTIALLVLILLVGFAGCAGCSTYNSLVSEDESVERAWADVETQYQRRADLIPNLVSTVRGAADFERETLEAVVNARSRASSINLEAGDLDDPAKMEAYMAAQNQLSGALSRLLVTVERYPELRATEAFRDLQTQLEGTENRITVARRDYNEAVRNYNTEVRRFPTSVVAGIFGFDRRTPFESDPGAEDAPTVDFGN